MKKILFACTLFFLVITAFSQSGKKPVAKDKIPTQKEMEKLLEGEMKGMSEDEKREMKDMMKAVMPSLQNVNNNMADYPEFTNNKQLIPKKNPEKIAISKRKITQAEMGSYATSLFNKIITRADAGEIALTKKIIAQNPRADAVGSAAVLCMMQGHPQAAMALSMKAVQTDPSNANWQNNMASLLTQYGYAEQAIPVLQKLKNQFPRNSTVLNNLGQAWLALGEIDSAKINIKRAGGLNPNHPEAKETEGVIEETTGNPEKAAEDYIKAIENAISPFTEELIKNSKGENGVNKIDFEKLKRSITIYEYFPKDWIKIPKLSDNVTGYESDMAQINGYHKMFEELRTRMDLLNDAAGDKIKSADDNEDAFTKEMVSETMRGLNIMSKPAIVVQKILALYGYQLTKEYAVEREALLERISNEKEKITREGKNDKCPDYDRKNNAYLSYANPLIRAFHEEKIEKFRTWLNATCTWVWYLAGNPKNISMITCISWTQAFENLCEEAVNDQKVEWRACTNHKGDDVAKIDLPEIPNFTCPTIVSVPFGNDWQQISSASKNFDNNINAVKKSAANAVPNHSCAYGANPNGIAQAGRDPFIKSANGSTSQGMINDEELNPLPKLPLEDLEPLRSITEELNPLPDLRKSKLAKELLKKMMTGSCSNVKNSKDILKENIEKMLKDVKELDAYENVIEQIKKLESDIDIKESNAQKKEELKKKIEKMKQETEKMDNYEKIQTSKSAMEKIMKEMDAMDDKKFMKKKFEKILQLVDEMEAAPSTLKGIQQNGLQPTISSGIQVPGIFSPVKALFN